MSVDYFYTNPESISLVGYILQCPYTWTVEAGQTVHFTANVSTKKSKELHALSMNLRKNDEKVSEAQIKAEDGFT